MNRSPWLESLFRPLVLGVMFGCVALSLVGLVHLFVPSWNATYLVVGCVVAAWEASYSYRLIQARSLRGTELLQFRAVELVIFFVLLKIGGHMGDSWSEVLAEMQTWPHDPLSLLDPETVSAFVLVLLSWHAATQTAHDLKQLGQPVERSLPSPIPPMQSLTERFFWGGAVLLTASGLTRIGIAELLNLRRPSVPGLVLNVLAYFLLGLVLLGQVQLATLRRGWQAQEIDVTESLPGRWVRYSLALIGLAAFLAFLLPTSHTVGLLDMAHMALNLVVTILSFIVQLLFLLAGLPLAWLLSKLLPEPAYLRQRAPPPVRLPPQGSGAPAGATPDWLEVLRSLVFWIIALGMLFYVVHSYLRDHPELVETLAMLRPIHLLRRWWVAFRRWLSGWMEAVSERIPRGLPLRMAWGRSSQTPWRFIRLGTLSPRERILYYYLSILRRADQRGFSRQRAQTPYEYNATLGPNLPQVRHEMTRLTQAFVEARYSQRVVDADQAGQVRAEWQRVKAALRALKRPGGDNESIS